jgi:FkbM family methyltransferase
MKNQKKQKEAMLRCQALFVSAFAFVAGAYFYKIMQPSPLLLRPLFAAKCRDPPPPQLCPHLYCPDCPDCPKPSPPCTKQHHGLLRPIQHWLTLPQPYAPLDDNGKLAIPAEIRQIRLDIGLSYSAPVSAKWLDKFPNDRMIYGFEPNLGSFTRILNDDRSVKSNFMDRSQFMKHFFMFNAALDEKSGYLPFYWTKGDPGTSSLNQPTGENPEILTKMAVRVPVITLTDFLAFIPWDRFPYIEFVKIDAQGADFRVLKGISDEYLDKIVFLALEKFATGYSSTHNENDLRNYLISKGWQVIDGSAENGSSIIFANTRHQSKWAVLDSWMP